MINIETKIEVIIEFIIKINNIQTILIMHVSYAKVATTAKRAEVQRGHVVCLQKLLKQTPYVLVTAKVTIE